MDDQLPRPDETPPAPHPHAFSPLRKAVWAVIGVSAAFGIFVVGLVSGGGTGCKDKAGNPTACSSGGAHGGVFFGGGGSSSGTARGGFGSAGAAHGGGGE